MISKQGLAMTAPKAICSCLQNLKISKELIQLTPHLKKIGLLTLNENNE